MLKTRITKTLFFFLLILILVACIFFFIKKQDNIDPKIFYSPALVKVNTEFNKKKDSFTGDEEEVELVSRYILINLFTINSIKEMNIKKLEEFIDDAYIEHFKKQYNNNIGYNIKQLAKIYKAENLPKVNEVKLVNVNDYYENFYGNTKKCIVYDITCRLFYNINQETLENKKLSEQAISKWPACLNLKIYWNKSENHWKIAKLDNIITNEYYEDY